MPSYRPRAFVCYARRDGAAVAEILTRIEAGGIDTWRDVDDLPPGIDWRIAIVRELRESDAALIFCGSGQLTVEQEAEVFAAMLSVRLVIPMLLPGYDQSGPPGKLARYQASDYRGTVPDPTPGVIEAVKQARVARLAFGPGP